jgi:hypothetical protein
MSSLKAKALRAGTSGRFTVLQRLARTVYRRAFFGNRLTTFAAVAGRSLAIFCLIQYLSLFKHIPHFYAFFQIFRSVNNQIQTEPIFNLLAYLYSLPHLP